MKKNRLFIGVIASMVLFGTSVSSAMAETKVIQLDDSTLKVTIYNGKPPHKRFIVKKDIDPSLYDQYAQKLTANSESTSEFLQNRRSSPGKY